MKFSKLFTIIRVRRLVQITCLVLFCLLLGAAHAGELFGLPADIFLRLDPLVGIAVSLAARQYIITLLPALIVILVTVLAGRIFCGWICPMGTTLDAGGSLARLARLARCKSKTQRTDPISRQTKYFILISVMVAALFGANVVFWVSPIPLVTRLYTIILHPLALLGMDSLLGAAVPIADQLGINEMQYWFPTLRSYHTAWFVAIFWVALFLLECIRPRFWCRYLCPAGALLALFSKLAFWKRRTHVADTGLADAGLHDAGLDTGLCNSCGHCAKSCPAGILDLKPASANFSECLTCRSCVKACKRQAVSFGLVGKQTKTPMPTANERLVNASLVNEPLASTSPSSKAAISHLVPSFHSPALKLSRRAFCGSVITGVVLAGVTSFEASGEASRSGIGGAIGVGGRQGLVRPPGSVPESDFLDLCVRCGECMKACPTAGLQPATLQAGFSGMFSPFLDPRSGPCDPECVACGAVCPSRAIQALPLQEKSWAKIGTAKVNKQLCLAWAEDKRCMVCQETCPYGAISVVPEVGHIAPVPVVRQERCYGCGFCEKHCPTLNPSIQVKAEGALRQYGNFETTARASGLQLNPAEHKAEQLEYNPSTGGAPPGFLE